MKKWSLMVFVTLAVTILGSSVSADEITELKKQLEMLQERIAKLEAKQKQQENQLVAQQQKINAQDIQIQSQDKQIDVKIAKAVEDKQITALPDSIKWIENIKLSGDFRLRHEHFDTETSGSNNQSRDRQRFRARIGLAAKVNEEVDFKLRLASGSEDPVSTNQSFDGGFTSKDIFIDRAYMDYKPNWWANMNIWGGKMPNPFFKPGGAQLIWDDDLNPEGFAFMYDIPMGDYDKIFLNGGGFYVEENSSSFDQSLWGAQAGIEHEFADASTLVAGASYFDYGNLGGKPFLDYDGGTLDRYGNIDADGDGNYDSDFDLVELFGEYKFKLANGLPMALYADWVRNTAAANTGEDTGWLIGAKLGKAKKVGSWELGYNYRVLEKDAVVGAFTDSDFIGGGTDGRGHKLGAKYQLAKNWQLGLTYFLNERGDGDQDYNRIQADLKFKF